MVNTLILIRHGETIWNQEGRFQGQTDVKLSETGLQQAEKTARFLKENYRVKAVYSSDLSRAYATAEAIAKQFNLVVQKDIRLREYSFGVWEGLTRSEIEEKYYSLYKARQKDIHVQVPGGEGAAQVQQRVMEAIQEICHTNQDTVVVVSHGGALRIALASILGLDLTYSYRIMLDNATLSIVRWELFGDEQRFMVETINSRLLFG